MTDLRTLWRSKQETETTNAQSVLQIRADAIRPNRAQPRAEFDNNAIIRLADSIRRYGILQPLTVRPSDSDDIYEYELIAGERRLRAAKLLGYLTVPCLIMSASEQDSAEMAIIENLLREDLNMFEQAYGFQKLIENHHLTQEEVAKRMSLSQSAVANKLRLLKLDYSEQQLILENRLTERHARALLKIDTHELRVEAIRHIAAHAMTVLNSEAYIESLLDAKQAPVKESSSEELPIEPYHSNLINSLKRRIDNIKRSGRDAKMCVHNHKNEIEIRIRVAK